MKDVFDRAVEWRIIKVNPVEAIKRPKISETAVTVYTESEVSEMLAALVNEPLHWRLMITRALTTGLRRGELLALEWKHLNLIDGVIDVKQSLSYIKRKHVIKLPKTKSSMRKVSIPEVLIPDLIQYHEQARLDRDQIDNHWEGGEHFIVFSSWQGKPYYITIQSQALGSVAF